MPDLSNILNAREPLTLAQVARGAQPLVMADLARASTGRARSPPEACSSKISTHPAVCRASDWGRGV